MEGTNGSIESRNYISTVISNEQKKFCWKFFDVIAFPSWHKANWKGYHEIQLTGTWIICENCSVRIVERAHVTIVNSSFDHFGCVRLR